MAFADVKAILDYAILGWRLKDGAAPDISGHTDGTGQTVMGWATRDQLVNAWAKTYQLIQPASRAPGKGRTANLIIDLTTGQGGHNRMPRGGPYLDDALVQKIVDWIEADCPP